MVQERESKRGPTIEPRWPNYSWVERLRSPSETSAGIDIPGRPLPTCSSNPYHDPLRCPGQHNTTHGSRAIELGPVARQHHSKPRLPASATAATFCAVRASPSQCRAAQRDIVKGEDVSNAEKRETKPTAARAHPCRPVYLPSVYQTQFSCPRRGRLPSRRRGSRAPGGAGSGPARRGRRRPRPHPRRTCTT
jgi:hypothetical protein